MSRTVWHPVWRRCVTGHWQYITVCKYNFYLCHHCIISLCLFIRPLRTQSPFFFLLAVFLLLSFFVCCFQSTEEDFRTLEGKIILKKKQKKKNLLFPLHCDGELHSEAVWDVRKEEHRLWIWSEHHDPPPPPPPPPCSLVFQQTRGRGGEEVRGRFRCHSTNLRLTVAYFDPLSDEITVTLHHE